MCFSAIAVANTILDMAAKRKINDMTQMKLQKLVFLAHALYLKKNNTPLIADTVEKWKYGPVITELYREFKGFGSSPITGYAKNADDTIDVVPEQRKEIYNHLNYVLDIFGNTDAIRLSQLTHMNNTAWSLAGSHWEISEQNIKDGTIYSDKVQ